MYKYLLLYLVFIITFIAWPLINGEAISGKNIFPIKGKMVASISPEYSEVANMINNDKTISNVLTYPQFSGVINHNNKLFVGRDILRTQINKSFLYNSFIKSNNNELSKKIADINNLNNFSNIKLLNIGYILIRKDDFENYNEKNHKFIERINKNNIATKVVSNQYLDLYRINKDYYVPRIMLGDDQATVSFTYISPIKYKININNLKNSEDLLFLESFNKYFKLYLQPYNNKIYIPCDIVNTVNNANECSSQTKYFRLIDLTYLYKHDIFDNTHKIAYNYANSWTLDADHIKNNYSNNYYSVNADESINFELILFYKPQALFYITQIIGYSALVLCLIYLIFIELFFRKKVVIL